MVALHNFFHRPETLELYDAAGGLTVAVKSANMTPRYMYICLLELKSLVVARCTTGSCFRVAYTNGFIL